MAFEPRRTTMPRNRHKPEEIVAKLRQVDVLVSQGQGVADAVRSIGVTEVTYYRWRQEFGGLKTDQVNRLKDLETENTRLRPTLAAHIPHSFAAIAFNALRQDWARSNRLQTYA